MNKFEVFEAKKEVTPAMINELGAIQPYLLDIDVATDKRVRVFDVEVFKHQSCVVFKTMNGTTDKIFTNNIKGLNKYIAKGIITELGFKGLEAYIKDKILIGYNNHNYDDKILNTMIVHSWRRPEIQQAYIKQTNDAIINGQRKGIWGIHTLPSLKDMITLDAMSEIHGTYPSLKKIEANMGISIKESTVDFTVTRPLTEAENLEVIEYCEYDVYATTLIAKKRQGYWTEKFQVLNLFDTLPKHSYRWTSTRIIGDLLKAKYPPSMQELSVLKYFHYVPQEVQDMWREIYEKPAIPVKFTPRIKKVKIREFDNDIVFSWGGLHGATDGYTHTKDVKMLDVNSMYPNIIILLNGLGDKTGYYKNILDYRFKLKAEGKKAEQAGYKLILNRVSGCFQYEYSPLCNPFLALNMRIYGQICIYVLAKKLYNAGANIINLNTDGVGFTGLTEQQMKDIQIEWEKEFNLELGLDEYDDWYQTGVNGYIAKEKGKDSYKVKGSDVNRVFSGFNFGPDNLRICQIALFNYITKGTPIADTIVNNLDKPELYQYVLNCTRKFVGVYDKDGNRYNKVNRIFAGKDTNFCLYKLKEDDDGYSYCRFPSAPQQMLLWNDDLSELKDFRNKIDLQYYYDVTENMLRRWK